MHKVFAAILLLLPGAVLGAGFSSQALFLSKSPVTEGEVVLIHAVVQNDTIEPFEGNLRFRIGEKNIGAVPAALEVGEARTLSLSWTPQAGSQTVTAELVSKDNTVAASEKATFSIAAKPKPLVAGTTTESQEVESSAQIQKMIETLSPAVARGTKPVFDTLDSWRERGAGLLDTKISEAQARLPQGGVLGAQADNASDPMGAAGRIFHTLYFYLLTLLRYILGSAALFYPVVAVGFLYLLWRLYRRMSAR